MDLGIAGRKAIVCASSKGLGRGCAEALAEAGCELTLNGRDTTVLEATAGIIRQASGVKVTAIAGDISKKEVQQAVLAACPAPDILVNNNGGPPPKSFRELDREVPYVRLMEACEGGNVFGDAVRGGGVAEDPGVGPSRHRNAIECVGNRKDVLEGSRHRPAAGASGEYKRTVDVEQDECGGARPNLRRGRCRRAAPWPMALRRS